MDRGSVEASKPEERRQQRLEQLQRMTDENLVAEVREHQAVDWQSEQKLREHARDHWAHCQRVFGRGLAPSELHEISRRLLWSWDRLLTGLQYGQVTYVFLSRPVVYS